MKKSALLNSSISHVVSKMGHTDTITIADAGLPIPQCTQRIDLAVTKGIPSFESVLLAILSELAVQKATIAKEMQSANPELYEKIIQHFTSEKIEIVQVPHEQFKELTKLSVAVVRTGECKPFANIILESTTVF